MLGDRTGAVPGMLWEELGLVTRLARAGEPVTVSGRFIVHPRFGPQINLRGLAEAVPGRYEDADLLDGPQRTAPQMEDEIRDLVATIQEPHLRLLLDRLLGETSPFWAAYRDAPAAKHHQQAH